ncbi:hypothetical protein BMF94_4134 [Rhodotorula taiwanensis]|uniref:F-box domain-containing protein n=1 Tax=Rhodotorula taiwanensis TaxID=741276 RepID=A0A2S5B7I5_9BASI|nr:hypothetical protein BMF94_4134 [Rhodotorula taiwanensis]
MNHAASTRPHRPASASSPDKPSPLLRLPDELLHAILDDLNPGDVKMCLDACRRLRAVAARRVFTAIRITDEADLLALATHFKHGCYVQSLTIDLEMSIDATESPRRRCPEYGGWIYEPDDWIPHTCSDGDSADEKGSQISEIDFEDNAQPVASEEIDLGGVAWTEQIFEVKADSSRSSLDSDEEGCDSFAATAQAVLRQMPNLAYLCLSHLDWSEYAAFLSEQTAPYLQGLVELELDTPQWFCSTLTSLDAVEWWPVIGGLPNLVALTFDDCFEICCARDSDVTTIELPNIKELVIKLNSNNVLEPYRSAFSLRVPNLEQLALRDASGLAPSGYHAILREVPATLKDLDLYSRPGLDSASADLDWTRFVNLRTLILGRSTFQPEGLLQRLLQLQQLTLLVFDIGAPIRDDVLAELLRQHRGLPHLERVQLDHVCCESGSLDEEHLSSEPRPYERFDTDTERHMWPGWLAPDWPEGCSEAGVADAIALAEHAGVELDGTALDTIGFQEVYDDEARLCMQKHAQWAGDLREAITEYGFDAALDFLKDEDQQWYRTLLKAINPGGSRHHTPTYYGN